MQSRTLFPINSFEYAEDPPTHVSTHNQTIELINEPIPLNSQINNWGFTMFFICFFIISHLISRRTLLFSMVNKLFRSETRNRVFFDMFGHDVFDKFLACFQTIFLVSIVIYCVASRKEIFLVESPEKMTIFIGATAIVLTAYFLYKFFIYAVIGRIFFTKELSVRWNEIYLSLICLSGIVLFVPALVLFYTEQAYHTCIYFMLLYAAFTLFVIFYKIYTLFFQGKSSLLYFILYLCAQEIIPLYLVYKGMVCLLLIAQKDTLWIQI